MARVTTLYQTPGNGLIDMSLPGAPDLLARAGDGAKLLGTFTAQQSTFPLGVSVLIASATGTVAAGELNANGDAAAKQVGTQVAFSATSTRALVRDVDTLLGQSNRVDPDTILRCRRIGWTVSAPNGDLDPFTGDFDILRYLCSRIFFNFQIGTLPIIRPSALRNWLDANQPQTAAAVATTASATTIQQEWMIGSDGPGPLDQVIFPEDQISCALTNPLALSGLTNSAYYAFRPYATGTRYQRAGGVGG
jgi:hypothetical protein